MQDYFKPKASTRQLSPFARGRIEEKGALAKMNGHAAIPPKLGAGARVRIEVESPAAPSKIDKTQYRLACDAALQYLERGWVPLPVKPGEKDTHETGWPTFDINKNNYRSQYFRPYAAWNVGLRMGGTSKGLTDVDLDCPEAMQLADIFLPTTEAEFGRKSKPRSHRLYYSDLWKTENKNGIKWTEYKKGQQGQCLVELRTGGGGKGAQTMAPPSLHPSGERVTWDKEGEAGTGDGAALKNCVEKLAFATLLLRHWPREKGSRNDHAMTIGGVLARAGWVASDISQVVEIAAYEAGDEQYTERGKTAARAVGMRAEGDKVSGLKRVGDVWGGIVADTLMKWLEIGSTDGEQYRANQPETRQLTVRWLTEFKPLDLTWLWWPFIPEGMITCIYGDGEVGKTTILRDLTVRITTGGSLPQVVGESEPGISASRVRIRELGQLAKGSVLICAKEEDTNRIILPRLKAMGADIGKVGMVGYDIPDNPDDFDPIERLDTTAQEIEQRVAEIGDVRLIIIESITDFLGKVNPSSDPEVRALLNPFNRIAGRHNLGFVYILHLNKKTDQPASTRGIGTMAFRNVPRSRVLVGINAEGSRYMVQEKKNLTEKRKALSFEIHPIPSDPKKSRIEWGDRWEDIDPNELLEAKKLSKQETAIRLLREWLANGPLPAREIYALAKEKDIGKNTVNTAKESIGIKPKKRKLGGWYWELPAGGFDGLDVD
jgi:hypothetical protein